MRWIEICINTKSGDIDAVCERLDALGISETLIEDENDFNAFLEDNKNYWDYVDDDLRLSFRGVSRVKCYLEDTPESRSLIEKIKSAFPEGFSASAVEDADWENNWREFYSRIDVGENISIVPAWDDDVPEGRAVIRLDPGLLFGTGTHATTQMCLSAVEKYMKRDAQVLDLGCGNGILGICALVLGVGRLVGIDIDPSAPHICAENAGLNGLPPSSYSFLCGDIISDENIRRNLEGKYDLLCANIVSDVIIPLSGFVSQFMHESSVLIASGIIDYREEETAAALERGGLEIIERLSLEEWRSFICRIVQ